MQNKEETNTLLRASLVDTHELARILRVTPRTIPNLIRRHQIPRVRIGNRNRFEPERVIEALAEASKGGVK